MNEFLLQDDKNSSQVLQTICWKIKSMVCTFSEAATRGFLCKKVFLEVSQNSQETICTRVSFFNKVAGLRPLFKKETLVKEFSCEFWEIFKNTFLTEHLWTTASNFWILRSSSQAGILKAMKYLICFCYIKKSFCYINIISLLYKDSLNLTLMGMISMSLNLTHFMPIVPNYSPWKHQKTRVVFWFQGE